MSPTAKAPTRSVAAAAHVALVVLGALVVACAPEDTSRRPAEALPNRTAATLQADAADTTTDYIITSTAMGPLRLGMTLQETRTAVPSAVFARTSDGDGVALVEITLAPGVSVQAWVGEDDRGADMAWTRPIEWLETFSPAFRTQDGVRVGALIDDVAKALGTVTEIVVSEIESRQFIRFANQPDGMTFRLDYTGVFPPGERHTKRYQAGAKIFSIAISPMPR